MMCPRCSNEWDVSKSPCSRCGLLVRVPGRSGTRSNTSATEGNTQTFPPPSSQISQPGGMPPMNWQSRGMQTIRQPARDVPPIGRPSNRSFSSPSTHMPIMPITPNPFSDMEYELEGNSEPSVHVQAQQQEQVEGTPSSFFMGSTPNTSRPVSSSSPNYSNNPFLTQPRKNELQPGQFSKQNNAAFGRDNASLRSVPLRPQTQLPLNRSTDNLPPDTQRPIRPSRLVIDPLSKEGQRSSFTPLSSSPGFTSSSSDLGSPLDLPVLSPGTLLRGGRYRLRALQDRQDWLDGVFEAMWIAQDAQRAGAQVMIRELVMPDSKSMVMQSTLRTATMALTSVGRHPHIPTLWDAFSDQGRNFFVFEPVEGESLVARMRRMGRALQEQDVIECCLQMTEILEILSQQSPPFVHGLIRPEHIIVRHSGSDYVLTNFSVILAGGATQFVAGIDRSYLSPYTSPEFIRGTIDVRADIYSLVATAYHAATGSIPASVGGIIAQSQRLNPTLSSAFDAILTRGLRPIASQRYQRPSELRQDLLAMRSVSSTHFSSSGPPSGPVSQRLDQPSTMQVSLSKPLMSANESSVSHLLPNMLASGAADVNDQERKLLLPRPEELPPMPERNDFRQAAYWLIGILICLITVIILSRGFL